MFFATALGDDDSGSNPNARQAHITLPRFCLDRFLHSFAKLRAWSKTLSSRLNHSLHLQTRERVRRTGRALPHMRIERPHLLRRKLSVDVGVEFYFPRLTSHFDPLHSSIHLIPRRSSDRKSV